MYIKADDIGFVFIRIRVNYFWEGSGVTNITRSLMLLTLANNSAFKIRRTYICDVQNDDEYIIECTSFILSSRINAIIDKMETRVIVFLYVITE